LTDLNTNISGSFISVHSLSSFLPAELVVFGLTANIHISPTANADIDKVGGGDRAKSEHVYFINGMLVLLLKLAKKS